MYSSQRSFGFRTVQDIRSYRFACACLSWCWCQVCLALCWMGMCSAASIFILGVTKDVRPFLCKTVISRSLHEDSCSPSSLGPGLHLAPWQLLAHAATRLVCLLPEAVSRTLSWNSYVTCPFIEGL